MQELHLNQQGSIYTVPSVLASFCRCDKTLAKSSLGRREFTQLIFVRRNPLIQGSQGRNSSRNIQMLLADSLFGALTGSCPASFLIWLRFTCLGVVLPTMVGPSYIHHQSGQSLTDMAMGQTELNNPSVEIPSDGSKLCPADG